MDADADSVRFHVVLPDHEHDVRFHLLGALNFARHLRLNWLLRTHGSLVNYNFMAEDDPILAALGLKARSASFRVSDIVLTAAMLAGGADPIHNSQIIIHDS